MQEIAKLGVSGHNGRIHLRFLNCTLKYRVLGRHSSTRKLPPRFFLAWILANTPIKWLLFASRQCPLLNSEREAISIPKVPSFIAARSRTALLTSARLSSSTIHRGKGFNAARQNYWNHNVNLPDGEVFVYLFGRGNYPTSLVFIPWNVKTSIKLVILFSKFTFGTLSALFTHEDCLPYVRRPSKEMADGNVVPMRIY